MSFSTLNFIYQWTTKPMIKPLENILELVNEYCILLCAYVMSVFSNTAISPKLAAYMGWAFLVIAVGNISINVVALSAT
jgi:hypothetical protein